MRVTRPTLCVALALLPVLAFGNNTGGVFGPVVNAGHSSAQYRVAVDDDDNLAQRLHYQAAYNDDLMWRVVGQLRTPDDRSTDFDYLQGELFWQLPNAAPNWRQGLRFDLRLRDDDRPHQLGLNWMHEFDLRNDWSARLLALTTVQFDDNRRSGVGLQARASLTRSLPERRRLSLSWFSDYGTTADTRSGSEQLHQVGPTFEMRFGERWHLLVGALFGVTAASDDATVRFWLTRSG